MNEELAILVHVMLAAFLCGIIGFERETYQKPAGLRTNMIVGGASALLVSLGGVIVFYFNEQGLTQYVSADPIRIIQAIVVGVSFIGAGTVLQIEREYKIKFLTTAATIFFSTGIGIAVALASIYPGLRGFRIHPHHQHADRADRRQTDQKKGEMIFLQYAPLCDLS